MSYKLPNFPNDTLIEFRQLNVSNVEQCRRKPESIQEFVENIPCNWNIFSRSEAYTWGISLGDVKFLGPNAVHNVKPKRWNFSLN